MAEASFNGIHANDSTFFEEVNQIVQEEPEGSLDPERAGQLGAIGIVRGRPFAPDERMRGILEEAARTGAGLARTLLDKPRDPDVFIFEGPSWKTAFVGGSYEILGAGARMLDKPHPHALPGRSRSRRSGRSTSTTLRPGPCCRPATPTPASTTGS
jgi:hypothetical protein